jgi:hypothetical protein
LQRRQSIKAQLFLVIQKLRERLAPVGLHGNALILDRDPGDELKFCLEFLDGDVEVKPPLGSRVWGNYENVDNA